VAWFRWFGIDDIADRGVHLVHQGHGAHFHRGADRAHHQSRIHRRRTVPEHQDFRVGFRFEAVLRDGDSIGSGGKIRDLERAVLGMSTTSRLVAILTAFTVASETTAPDGSVTVPVMAPKVCWADANCVRKASAKLLPPGNRQLREEVCGNVEERRFSAA
jgi:hypothetical protein